MTTATKTKRADDDEIAVAVAPEAEEQVQRIIGDAPSGYLNIEVGEIHVDPRYQRGLNQRRLQRLVREWNPSLADPIRVNWREDGTIWVIDGQHRLAAAKAVGNKMIECKVHMSLTPDQEAAVWNLLQSGRVAPTLGDAFRSRLFAREPVAVQLEEIVHKFGGTLSLNNSNSSAKRPVHALATIESILTFQGEDGLNRVMTTLAEAYPEDQQVFSEAMLNGLSIFYHIYDEEFDDDRLMAALRRTSPRKLFQAAMALKQQLGGSTTAHIASSIVREYNTRLTRNRLDPNKALTIPRGLGRSKKWKTQRTHTQENLLAKLKDVDLARVPPQYVPS